MGKIHENRVFETLVILWYASKATVSGSALLVVRKGPTTKNKKLKIEKKLFYFKQQKETRNIAINASQLVIINFNDIT